MKKIYATLFLSAVAIFSFAQNSRKATLSSITPVACKSCITQPDVVLDTLCNFEADDTLAVYYSDLTPHDSGWIVGHNAFQDMAWAERYAITGSANVLGGVYLLYEKSGSCTGTASSKAHVYPTTGTGGKPGASLGSVTLPNASLTVTGAGHIFTFTTPIAVTSSFFMGYELGTYTLGGPDTIGIVTSRHGNRSTSNPDQNCAMWSDGTWQFELTENFGLKVTYGLCAIVDIAGGVENYVSKGDLNLYAAYPNPASNMVTINYSLQNAGKVNIEIFDAQGKSLMKMEKGSQSSGMHKEEINTSFLPEGSYFYKVAAENGTVFSRFSVVK